MKSKTVRTLLWAVGVMLLVGACDLIAGPVPLPTADVNALYTQAAATLQAQFTSEAIVTLIAQLSVTPTPTSIEPTPTAEPTQTQVPPTEALPTATSTPPPIPTSTPTATRTTSTTGSGAATAVVYCDRAQFVADVTVTDGAVFAPEASFSKVWRLKNNGTCTWDKNYALVFVSGDRLGASKEVKLKSKVRPGETVDIAVEFEAPEKAGSYRGYWMLRNASDDRFGTGSDASKAIWVDIKVVKSKPKGVYDLAANMCTASWESSAGGLVCPSDTDSKNGSVAFLQQPVLEGGRHDDENTLWTRPHITRDGWIMGTYPSFKVEAGDHFFADVGCLDDSKGCDVSFVVSYRIGDGKKVKLGDYRELFDGQFTRIDIDLSSLAGERIRLILRVNNNGKPSAANAFWMAPHVRNVAP